MSILFFEWRAIMFGEIRDTGLKASADQEWNLFMVICYGKHSEGVLDRALRSCYGCKRKIERGEHGKPVFAEGGDFLSITHTSVNDEKIWIAVFGDREIGIDAESYDRSVKNAVTIAKRYFTEGEADYLTGVPDREKEKVFIRMWTMKEAYLKMKGTGISGGLDSVELVENNRLLEYTAGAHFIDIKIEDLPELCVTLAIAKSEKASDDMPDISVVKLGD